jgi:hypothetical protein
MATHSLKDRTTKKLLMVFSLLISLQSQAALFYSDTTNAISVGVCGVTGIRVDQTDWITNATPVGFDEKMTMGAYCTTGTVSVLFPVNKSVFINFQMQDRFGKKVEKTPEGRLWGADVKDFPESPGRNPRNRMASGTAAPLHSDKNPALALGWSLPAPRDLFMIEENGVYTLSLEVHLMRQRSSTNDWGWTWEHITIPPFKVSVQKP